jgi:hypothetical protein
VLGSVDNSRDLRIAQQSLNGLVWVNLSLGDLSSKTLQRLPSDSLIHFAFKAV